MLFMDVVAIGDARVTRDGYLVVDAKIARTGIQVYAGAEMGRPDLASVRVFRPEEEVFAGDAMASLAHRPMTVDHPREAVTADNWKRHAVGFVGGEVARDGDYIRVPLTIMDKGAIDEVRGGKRQLSVGYSCDVEWTGGKTASGEAYDAIQRNIRGNHLAIVDAARAGPACRIGDSFASPIIEKDTPAMADKPLKTVTVDGLSIETTDQGAQVIDKLMRQLADATTAAETAKAAHTAALAAKDKELGTKDAEIEKLKASQLDDGKVDALVAARVDVVAKAKRIASDLKTDGVSVPAIRRAAVVAKVGEARIKDKSDEYVEGLFDTLAADAGDPIRDALKDGIVTGDDKAPADARAKMIADMKAGHLPATT